MHYRRFILYIQTSLSEVECRYEVVVVHRAGLGHAGPADDQSSTGTVFVIIGFAEGEGHSMVAAVKYDQRVFGEAFFLEYIEHRPYGIVEPSDIGVIAREFPADVWQIFEEARHAGDLFRLDPAAGRFTSGEVASPVDADERAVGIVTVDVVEKRAALLTGHPEELPGSRRQLGRATADRVIRDIDIEFPGR